MIILSKNNRQVYLRKLKLRDLVKLCSYFKQLSVTTRKRFGPHPFDMVSVSTVYADPGTYTGYIAIDVITEEIIAYSIIKIGYLEHDLLRLQSYGISPDKKSDCTFAPSVADAWQSCGVGNSLFNFILSDLKANGIKRIILWGGVQKDNEKAVGLYQKNHFKIAGQFYFNGENYDMILDNL
jgi:diamine N-acetyltransferase